MADTDAEIGQATREIHSLESEIADLSDELQRHIGNWCTIAEELKRDPRNVLTTHREALKSVDKNLLVETLRRLDQAYRRKSELQVKIDRLLGKPLARRPAKA